MDGGGVSGVLSPGGRHFLLNLKAAAAVLTAPVEFFSAKNFKTRV